MQESSTYETNVKLLKSWKTGFATFNKEPCLMVELHDGSHVEIMMPAQTAIEMSKGLLIEGERALKPSDQKLN
jgi:hypothetical protein